MADVIVDVPPGEVHWFAGCGALPVIGPCPHDCDHGGTRVIAWGPDYEHYTLNQCNKCGCRAWLASYPPGMGPRRREGVWREVRSD